MWGVTLLAAYFNSYVFRNKFADFLFIVLWMNLCSVTDNALARNFINVILQLLKVVIKTIFLLFYVSFVFIYFTCFFGLFFFLHTNRKQQNALQTPTKSLLAAAADEQQLPFFVWYTTTLHRYENFSTLIFFLTYVSLFHFLKIHFFGAE